LKDAAFSLSLSDFLSSYSSFLSSPSQLNYFSFLFVLALLLSHQPFIPRLVKLHCYGDGRPDHSRNIPLLSKRERERERGRSKASRPWVQPVESAVSARIHYSAERERERFCPAPTWRAKINC
jgi:hypothetical protein